MNREIKFRAWDGERIIFFSKLSIGIGKGYLPHDTKSIRDKEPYVYFTEDTFNGEVTLGTHEIMQYTGLQDKNGVEIYEGDLVLHDSGNIPSHKIIYSIDGFKLKRLLTNQLLPMRGVYKKTEVVGNIYQNPELIK